ncbi:hypothetical protein BC938DRAFT_482504 [Jimgerdemannia flammicorona]|uniref:tRNA-dihydrouridine(47) synthase [NAD(P)(+)] n=1 Tax=Jimgerdemannia flammicorona TaxID=994334 RepID=A0A433QDV9_9FUNG|nr:hypothetical protein BC938DRAFT_482504 [Jimgerdemannia flammicorona]
MFKKHSFFATMTNPTGIAPIKKEYICSKQPGDDEDSFRAGVFGDDEREATLKLNVGAQDQGGSPNKKRKHERGRNTGLRGKKRVEDEIKICMKIANDEVCAFGDNCKSSHDLSAYLQNKPEDLGSRCINFEIFGKCPYGYKCRFLKAHQTEDGKLVVNEQLAASPPVATKNMVDREVQKELRLHQFKFPKATAYAMELEAEALAEAEQGRLLKEKKLTAIVGTAASTTNAATTTTNTSGRTIPQTESAVEQNPSQNCEAVTNENVEKIDDNAKFDGSGGVVMTIETETATSEIKARIGAVIDQRDSKKKIDFRDKLYLAPLTTVGNLPFRRICKEFGADITCGEMAMAPNLLQGQQSEWALTRRHVSEDIFGIQVCGSKPDILTRCAEVISQTIEVDFVDVNLGCPIDLVYNKGAGSALLDYPGKLGKILRGMRRVLDVAVTVKIRMGVKDSSPTAHKLVPKFQTWGIGLTTIHGRSRQQRYTKAANWDYITEVKKLAPDMHIFGNGDVFSYEDYYGFKEKSGVDGIMIGRGALIKPWLFDEIKSRRHWDISSRERFDILRKFSDYGLEHWGSDTQVTCAFPSSKQRIGAKAQANSGIQYSPY